MSTVPSLASRIFVPVRSVILRILPDFADRTLSDPVVREQIIAIAEITLLNEFPASRALSPTLRKHIISHILEAVFGEAGARSTPAPEAIIDALGLSDAELAELEASAPGNSVRGFILDAEPGIEPDAIAAAVTTILGEGWETTALSKVDPVSFRAIHTEAILSVPEAWGRSHSLEQHPAVALAEPEIEWVPAPPEIGGDAPDLGTSFHRSARGPKHRWCSTAKDWHLPIIRAAEAWKIGASRGEGVTIAHLDTGVTEHVETPLTGGNIKVRDHNNLYDWTTSPHGNRPIDAMTGGFGNFPGHGTGTLSILTGNQQLKGTATKATVVPYRVGPSVVHFDHVRIATAIQRAHQDGCDVITMSMGGPPSRTKWLDRVVAAAAEDGVIMCTAAGNILGSNNFAYLVVWPAALDQVIAVAGCTCEERVWSGSSRGPEVNITAAAEDVWRAVAGTADKVEPGSGTSFATPTIAGMAACWLSHHGGRKKLTQHYGHARYVPLAFAHILRTTAFRHPDHGWDTRRMGVGILDASKLMAAQLPLKSELQSWPKKEHPWFGEAVGGFFKIINRRSAPGTRSAPEADAQRFSGELAYHFFDRPALRAMAASTAASQTSRSGRPSLQEEEAVIEAATLLRSIASDQLVDALVITPIDDI